MPAKNHTTVEIEKEEIKCPVKSDIPTQGKHIFSKSFLNRSGSFREKSKTVYTAPPAKYNASFNTGSKKITNDKSNKDKDKDTSYRSTLGRLTLKQKFFGGDKSFKDNNNQPIKQEIIAKDGPEYPLINSTLRSSASSINSGSTVINAAPKSSEFSKIPSVSSVHTSLDTTLDHFDTFTDCTRRENITFGEGENVTFINQTNYVSTADLAIHAGYVGFANLPNQIYRAAVKKGFYFNLMVVGESGLGKSTLINSMFLTDVYNAENPGPSFRAKKTVAVETNKLLLKENGVSLNLTIVDTPGFGDAVDNSNCFAPIVEYIESKYNEFLNAETKVNREPVPDNRVHCCIYFIAPTGHGLKALDIETMRHLHDKVNIVPVIAKADTLTHEECAYFKKQILNEIAKHKIKIYDFPEPKDEEDDKSQKVIRKFPFAVIGSNMKIEKGGKQVHIRQYPWGIVEIENVAHCDFVDLQSMLIRTHLRDLIDVTNNVHYENYRFRTLAGIGPDGQPKIQPHKDLLTHLEDEKIEREEKVKKAEAQMIQIFTAKLDEREQQMQDMEAEYRQKHDDMINSLEEKMFELEELAQNFEANKAAWELQTGQKLNDSCKSLESSKDSGKKIKKKSFF